MPGAAPNARNLSRDLAATLSPEPVIDEFVRFMPPPPLQACAV